MYAIYKQTRKLCDLQYYIQAFFVQVNEDFPKFIG